jgi:uncharacterized protein YhfF
VHTTRALILDVAHRVLALKAPDDTWHVPATIARVGERPLVAIDAFARERLSIELPYPSGATPQPTPHDFVFVLPPGAQVEAEGTRWVALRDLATVADSELLWGLYVEGMLGGWAPPTRTIDVFHFGADARTAAHLAHLVVKGPKRATAGWIEAERLEGATIPEPGMVSLVTDGFGVPVCAIRTERVDQLRLSEVDEAVARDEGEGDRSLEDWVEGHRRYFVRQGAAVGLPFTDEALIYVERFQLLKVLGTPA